MWYPLALLSFQVLKRLHG
uniref:Uncharacterized protein n=1 Tax=Arundo donax TaxID=35708 RepID=A0A0A9B302_ARUDO